jgi:hypothetical protein
MLVDGHGAEEDVTTEADRWPLLSAAALASIGAGAIHAVAAGAHSEHRQAVWTFVALAVAQIAWGILALARPSRAVAAVGAGLGVAAVAGWLAAKTTGIGIIDGLEGAEAVQWADGIAAALALVALGACVVTMFDLPAPALLSPIAVAVILVATLPGMVLAGSHAHSGGHGDDVAHGDDHAGDDHSDDAAHADDGSHTDDVAHADGSHTDGSHTDDADHGAVVPPTPYDPAMPIDLSGVDGVTPQQQAAAENLIAVTLSRLPQFADPATAESHGYYSIGDAGTGYEHYVNWGSINDDVILDPDAPESLVFQVVGGQKTLVAAMFMLPDGVTLDQVPELGGRLTQWHIHDNLCYSLDPVAPKVVGLREPGGPCREGQRPGRENAMIHVWIVPHECGPFAALEGVGGGTIAEGEERWCDHAHGA